MAKKNIDDISFEDFNDFGTGKFTGQDELLDRLDDEDDDNGLEDLSEDDIETEKHKKSVATIKPKLMGKHSLAHDAMFKGKKTVPQENELLQEEYIIKENSGSFQMGEDSLEYEVSRNNIDYQRNLKLQQEIFNLLKTNTDLRMDGPRRKPSKYDLNNYYKILLIDLSKSGYTHVEVFVELSLYFSDNIWGIYTLLDNVYKEIVIKELAEKYGLSQMKKINFF